MPKFLSDALKSGRLVKVITTNGYRMEGELVDFDISTTYGAITLSIDGVERLIMISAISTII